jgi:hypothetical protein
MFEGLVWQDDRVLMGDVVLCLDHGKDRKPGDQGDGCLGFFKNRPLVEQYEQFFGARPRSELRGVLELGIWDGGSIAFWLEHLRPARLSAVDWLDREDNPYFTAYLARRGLTDRVRTHWRLDQSDGAALRRIVDDELHGELDLVIDDGSHRYGPTRASFEALFPRLAPGGLYVIEDWAWEHWAEVHDFGAPPAERDSPTRLIFELVEAAGSDKQLIAAVHVYAGFVVVERGPAAVESLDLGRTIVRRPAVAPRDQPVRAIAMYLPQFHPIAENDAWWGKGYTEWTRVARAKPLYPGHQQPQLPLDELGFYDLRRPAVRAAQAELARAHGVSAFCYYHFWFSGRRLLERPFAEVLASGAPDFPFCLAWANENWTRRWDGGESTILLEQRHAPADDEAFIADLLPAFRDPRYLRVGGAPLFIVYRPGLLADPAATLARWRELCARAGIPRLHLVAAQTFGFVDPRPAGFDAAVEFPPHGDGEGCALLEQPGSPDELIVMSYADVVARRLARSSPPFRLYRTAAAGWDNSARRGARGTVLHGSSPEAYEGWLRDLHAQAARHPPDERLVFINAWNEWGEGAHLEPDTRHGTGYLEATRRVMG